MNGAAGRNRSLRSFQPGERLAGDFVNSAVMIGTLPYQNSTGKQTGFFSSVILFPKVLITFGGERFYRRRTSCQQA